MGRQQTNRIMNDRMNYFWIVLFAREKKHFAEFRKFFQIQLTRQILISNPNQEKRLNFMPEKNLYLHQL